MIERDFEAETPIQNPFEIGLRSGHETRRVLLQKGRFREEEPVFGAVKPRTAFPIARPAKFVLFKLTPIRN
jgi:hypothetical protein